MKKYCKNVDVADRNLISIAAYKCLDGKYKRHDTLRMLSHYSGLSQNMIYCIIYRYNSAAIFWIVELVIDEIRNEIITDTISFPKIYYRTKIDPSSHKIRKIGIQNIKQQIYDYIAVEALSPLLCRIGEFQCASIKGRGQSYGVRHIRRWLRNKSIKYLGQADIRKCYESIKIESLMEFLQKHIRNDLLLHLIQKLLNSFKNGLSIGSYLSQFLCNLYLSELYHEIAEYMYRIRKHKDGTIERVNLVKHVLFFMDDIFICGTNAKDLHKAIKLIQKKVTQMGIEIKPSWKIFKAKINDKKDSSGQFVDIMGFRIYRWHVSIRQRVFKRIRRAYIRTHRKIKTHKYIPIHLARRCLSYYGFIKNSDSYFFKQKYHVKDVNKICKRVVSNYDGTIQCAAISRCA